MWLCHWLSVLELAVTQLEWHGSCFCFRLRKEAAALCGAENWMIIVVAPFAYAWETWDKWEYTLILAPNTNENQPLWDEWLLLYRIVWEWILLHACSMYMEWKWEWMNPLDCCFHMTYMWHLSFLFLFFCFALVKDLVCIMDFPYMHIQFRNLNLQLTNKLHNLRSLDKKIYT